MTSHQRNPVTIGRPVRHALTLLGIAVIALAALRILHEALAADGAASVDFAAFWVAGRMAWGAEASLAYDRSVFLQTVAAMLGVVPNPLLAWLNPPGFLVLLLPFALLPIGWAWIVWSAVGAALLALAAWVVLPRREAVVAALVAPASMINLGLGQNGTITASLLVLGLAALDRRPLVAGVCFGLMTFKPQFGLVLPVLIVATGRWRCFAAAVATASIMAALSAVLFGLDAWPAFLGSLPGNSALVLHPPPGAVLKVQSLVVALLRAGAPVPLAWAIHGAVAAGAMLLALRLWRDPPAAGTSTEARIVATLAASFLVTPYVFPYDGVALALAGILLVRAGLHRGVLPGDLGLVLFANALPLLPIIATIHIAMPAAWLVMLLLTLRRVMADASHVRPDMTPR